MANAAEQWLQRLASARTASRHSTQRFLLPAATASSSKRHESTGVRPSQTKAMIGEKMIALKTAVTTLAPRDLATRAVTTIRTHQVMIITAKNTNADPNIKYSIPFE
jgi:hypothetical protein